MRTIRSCPRRDRVGVSPLGRSPPATSPRRAFARLVARTGMAERGRCGVMVHPSSDRRRSGLAPVGFPGGDAVLMAHALGGSQGDLVGREREIALLRERLAEAEDGRGGVVAVYGEPGIGKTSLAGAGIRRAGAAGRRGGALGAPLRGGLGAAVRSVDGGLRRPGAHDGPAAPGDRPGCPRDRGIGTRAAGAGARTHVAAGRGAGAADAGGGMAPPARRDGVPVDRRGGRAAVAAGARRPAVGGRAVARGAVQSRPPAAAGAGRGPPAGGRDLPRRRVESRPPADRGARVAAAGDRGGKAGRFHSPPPSGSTGSTRTCHPTDAWWRG